MTCALQRMVCPLVVCTRPDSALKWEVQEIRAGELQACWRMCRQGTMPPRLRHVSWRPRTSRRLHMAGRCSMQRESSSHAAHRRSRPWCPRKSCRRGAPQPAWAMQVGAMSGLASAGIRDVCIPALSQQCKQASELAAWLAKRAGRAPRPAGLPSSEACPSTHPPLPSLPGT